MNSKVHGLVVVKVWSTLSTLGGKFALPALVLASMELKPEAEMLAAMVTKPEPYARLNRSAWSSKSRFAFPGLAAKQCVRGQKERQKRRMAEGRDLVRKRTRKGRDSI